MPTAVAAARGRAITNARILRCGDCGLESTPGPMRLHQCPPSCSALHMRLVRKRGAAKNHKCKDCGSRARDWSYNYLDLEELQDNEGRYSLDLSNYDPRCRACHIVHDQLQDPTIRDAKVLVGVALGSSGLGAAATRKKFKGV